MNLVRSALFALAFYSGTVIAVLLAFPIGLFGTRAIRRWSHLWTDYHSVCARYLLGIRARPEGERPRGAVIVAAKHQSMYETIELVRFLEEPAIVLKHELADIPLFGWVVRRYGVIPVDRSAGAPALRRMMRAAEAAVAEGRPILIFPEGTRVAVGETPPLQPGFAGLYRALGLAVAPVALDSGRLCPRNAFVKRPGVITLRFMPHVPAGLPRREIEAAVHTAINALEPGHG